MNKNDEFFIFGRLVYGSESDIYKYILRRDLQFIVGTLILLVI